jgi:integrase
LKTRLTELTVSRAIGKPGETRDLRDGLIPGLTLRVGERAKSWSLLYRINGRQRRLKLGSWPAVGLSDARKLAKGVLLKVAEGQDPAAERAASPKLDTFEVLAAEYIERHVKARHKRARDTELMIAHKLVERWRGRMVASITRHDVMTVLDTEMDIGRERTANKLLVVVRRMFAWAIERGLIDANPASNIRKPGRERTRERVLTDAELAAVWHACAGLGWPWSGFVRLLICTALRRSEIAWLRWPEIDLARRVLVLSGDRTKSGRSQETPLNALAMETIESLPRVGDSWVFPARRQTSANPISGFGKTKLRLDHLSGVKDWCLHDLRRTAASTMARLGVAPQVLARVLNHSAGAGLPGVLAVYNRHSYDAEARAALDAWSRELDRIVGRGEARVISLR